MAGRVVIVIVVALIVLNAVTSYLFFAEHQRSEMLVSEHRSLEEEYERLGAQYSELERKHAELQEEYSRLQSELQRLLSTYGPLHSNYTELKASYEGLLNELTVLKSGYEDLLAEYTALKSSYEALVKERDALRAEYEALLKDYNTLRDRYNALVEEYNALKRLYEALLGEYHVLKEQYEVLRLEYEHLFERVKHVNAWKGATLDPLLVKGLFAELLSLAVESVESISDIDLHWFEGTLHERVLKVFNFTVNNLYYCHNPYVRYIDEVMRTVKARNEVFMLPNETWRVTCGDCDDLSLFAYAILKATGRPGERFYIILMYGSGGGLYSLVAVDTSEGVKKYYVVDPAGNFLNGVGVFYKVTMTNKDGYTRDYGLSPVDISSELKRNLVELGLAEVVFYEYRTGAKSTTPLLRYYVSAFEALDEWYRYWEARVGRL